MKNILVIGLGLIGGSIAKSLNKKEFNVFGMDTNSQTIKKATSDKAISQKCNHIEEFLAHNNDGIIVFATSPSATAIFVPDKVPPVKEQLMLVSVGEVLVSL